MKKKNYDDNVLKNAPFLLNSVELLSIKDADTPLREIALEMAKNQYLLLKFLVLKDEVSVHLKSSRF